VAVSPRGDVASGAQDGGVMVYEGASGAVHAATNLHTARVFEILWRGDELLTSSWDGSVRTWHRDLTVDGVARVHRPVRELRPLNSGWAASVGATSLWFRGEDMDLQLETGPLIRDLSASPDGRFATAVVSGDLIVYDTRDNAIASVRLGDPSADCAQFVDTATIMACGSSDEILSIHVDTLPFVKLDPSQRRSHEARLPTERNH
jgi:WD40 repeat protein